jgi:fatty acid/phospholipid biosynthesis enzyme
MQRSHGAKSWGAEVFCFGREMARQKRFELQSHMEFSERLLASKASPLNATRTVETFQWSVFLGLNGIVIKSHGGSDTKGFADAINLG